MARDTKFVWGPPGVSKSGIIAAVIASEKRAKQVERIEIDSDLWAESGGTIGMFGKAHREGRLTITSTEDGERIYRINGVDQ